MAMEIIQTGKTLQLNVDFYEGLEGSGIEEGAGKREGGETSQKGAETSEDAKKEQKRTETKAETWKMHCIFYSISVGSSKIRV